MTDWPKLPKSIMGISGSIPVLRPIHTPNRCYGEWDPNARWIRVEAVLPRETALRFFLHELTHAAIHDAGLESEIPAALHESLCGAISSQMMHVARWLLDAEGLGKEPAPKQNGRQRTVKRRRRPPREPIDRE